MTQLLTFFLSPLISRGFEHLTNVMTDTYLPKLTRNDSFPQEEKKPHNNNLAVNNHFQTSLWVFFFLFFKGNIDLNTYIKKLH